MYGGQVTGTVLRVNDVSIKPEKMMAVLDAQLYTKRY